MPWTLVCRAICHDMVPLFLHCPYAAQLHALATICTSHQAGGCCLSTPHPRRKAGLICTFRPSPASRLKTILASSALPGSQATNNLLPCLSNSSCLVTNLLVQRLLATPALPARKFGSSCLIMHLLAQQAFYHNTIYSVSPQKPGLILSQSAKQGKCFLAVILLSRQSVQEDCLAASYLPFCLR